MRFAPLLAMLARYRDCHPRETDTVHRMVQLIEQHDDCLLRTCQPGHITASAWIVAPDRRRFLMTHHRKLKRWLQLGGHVDGEPQPHLAALREAREESGMQRFLLLPDRGDPLPVDIDIHTIPAHGAEAAHEHHDIRFLLVAEPLQDLRCSDESLDLRWFEPAQLASLDTDDSVLRLAQKAERLLSA